MKKKLLVIIGLVIMLAAVSSLSYAYWDSLTDEANDVITVGERATVTVSETTAGTGTLVPVGAVAAASDVTSITYTHTVVINKAPVTALDLLVTISDLAVTGVTDPDFSGLIFTINGVPGLNTTLTDAFSSSATTVTVTVVITVNAGLTETAYQTIANQEINFNISFTAE